MAYITDAHATEYGLDPHDEATTRQVLADSGLVYDHVTENPWVTPGDLSKWAESQWAEQAPDRLNAARDILLRAGRIYDIGATPRANPITT